MLLKKCQKKYNYIFTSGGIGTTHDDVTYLSIATAFGQKLKLHDGTLSRMKKSYAKKGTILNKERKKMATLPEKCKVLWTKDLWVPLVYVNNVYILPGIPSLFEKMIVENLDHFEGGVVLSRRFIFTEKYEGDWSDKLSDIHEKYGKEVCFFFLGLFNFFFGEISIGSYPNMSEEKWYNVYVSLEGIDEELLDHVEGLVVDITGGTTKNKRPF